MPVRAFRGAAAWRYLAGMPGCAVRGAAALRSGNAQASFFLRTMAMVLR